MPKPPRVPTITPTSTGRIIRYPDGRHELRSPGDEDAPAFTIDVDKSTGGLALRITPDPPRPKR